MINKEASEVLKASSIQQMSFCKVIVDGKAFNVKEALNMAINVLKQQPCDDCISRQAVDTLVDELARAISDERCCMSRGRSTATIMQDILDLPSVTPKEKTGKWINDWEMGMSECSICGETYLWEDYKGTENFHYCPNCGARMVSE